MLWIRLGTHITDHERFLEAGNAARDLYVWGMLYAGKHETDGELPMAAVIASAWGLGGKANIKPALKLVEVGLWLRTTRGFSVCRWAEQGNETKESLTDKRKVGRERKARFDVMKRDRNGVTNGGSNAKGSTSTSLSDLGSDLESPREEVTEVRPKRADTGEPPPWFATAVDVIAMGTGVTLPVAESWLRYDGHREGKGLTRTPKDAQYWLTTVMVPEAREVLRRGARDKDRDEAFRRDKLGIAPKAQDSRKAFKERDAWADTAGPPDPEAQARLNKLLGKVGT